MLETIRIVNFALIDELTVDFKKGLNIFTGSTGAGKTIIIDALSLALGERASDDSIRTGAAQTIIEASFSELSAQTLTDKDLTNESEFIIRREINRDGKSKIFINSRQVTLQYLRNLGRDIVSITGQHEQKGLMDNTSHRQILDNFAGLKDELLALEEIHNTYLRIKAELETIRKRQADSSSERELLAFQVKEIDAASLAENEDEKLDQEKLRLVNAEAVKTICRLCQDVIFEESGSASERLKICSKEMTKAARFSEQAESIRVKIEEQLLNLEEIGGLLNKMESAFESDPGRLEIVEDRISLIKKLKKKYGQSIIEIDDFLIQAKNKLGGYEDLGGQIKKLSAELESCRAKLSAQAVEISDKRKKTALKIEKEVIGHLSDLAMQGSSFKVDFQIRQDPEGPFIVDSQTLAGDQNGYDKIEFLICPNPGEGLKPLASTASGGELSRILLALCSALSQVYPAQTLVFDEIDAGISGEVASQVGKKLQRLAQARQVICITHLQQIASRGEAHYKVYKGKLKGRAVTRIKLLEGQDRIVEIARLLAGEKISDITLDGAAQLLEEGNK
jgi:DNA repair protein RecN (Recombination protein N)